mmetsp:Transcript_23302/g.32587  ORF Transcript_23302/g.32587 Transcript_23302/m.32587 type:complete len:143 (-) Transcript_23302:222-650(-)
MLPPPPREVTDGESVRLLPEIFLCAPPVNEAEEKEWELAGITLNEAAANLDGAAFCTALRLVASTFRLSSFLIDGGGVLLLAAGGFFSSGAVVLIVIGTCMPDAAVAAPAEATVVAAATFEDRVFSSSSSDSSSYPGSSSFC